MTAPTATARPIGAIIQEVHESRITNSLDRPRDAAIALTFEVFDRVFDDRPDYQLWRTAVPGQLLKGKALHAGVRTLPPAGWPKWPALMSSAVESADPVVLWSLIALAPGILRPEWESGDANVDRALFDFASRLFARLQELPPLDSCPASCGIAASGFLVARQRFNRQRALDRGLADCKDLFRRVRTWIRLVDREWEPGQKLNLKNFRLEQGANKLIPGHPGSPQFDVVGRMLANLQSTLAPQIRTINSESERLLKEAYKFSRSALHVASDGRIFETQRRRSARNKTERSNANTRVKDAFLLEFFCRYQTSTAARDAGEYLESAKHLYLLFRLIPDEFVHDREVRKTLRRRSATIRYLKEVGLELDDRFSADHATRRKWTEERHSRLAREWEEPEAAETSDPAATPEPQDDVGFSIRVRHDQKTYPAWKTLLEFKARRSSQSVTDHLKQLMNGLADGGLPAPPEALEAGFHVALRYGYVRSAGKILERAVRRSEFVLTSDLLVKFVRAVRRCTQLDPFGVRHERWQELQQQIKDGCQLLVDNDPQGWLSGSDRLAVHEVLTNRTLVHHISLGARDARRLFQKSTGIFDINELREYYDLDYDFHLRTQGVATRKAIARRFTELSSSPLGAPVGVSLMVLGKAVSIVGIGKGGKVVADVCIEPELKVHVAELAAEAIYWFKDEVTEANQEIPWRESLRRVAHTVAVVSERCDPSARVILLSMDTALAQLPWQHLINLTGSLTGTLVSIVPSLTAFILPDLKTASPAGLRTRLSTEQGGEIAEIVQAVTESTSSLDSCACDVCIVAGHGSPPAEDGLPAVRIGANDVIDTLDKWLDIAGSRVSVLHSCHSGQPRPLFMEEFGGIAGLAICLGTRAVLAPVTEVFPATAVALQRSLFIDPGREIGASYLEAVDGTPSCCLYNLYGSPYETIAVPRAIVEVLAGPNRSHDSEAPAELPAAPGRSATNRSTAAVRRHYLKVPSTIYNYFPDDPPPDWKKRVFDDATERGTRLTLMELEPNEKGARAALFGDEFYFEVGRDNVRIDTLFVMRIERARLPTRTPRTVVCEVRLLSEGDPELLDSVEALFGESPASDALVLVSSSPRRAIAPSGNVRDLLARLSPEMRAQFRPSTESSAKRARLASLRTLWKLHRLERLIQPSLRQVALLNGAIQPESLADDEWDALVDLFGFRMLNNLVGHQDLRSQFDRVLQGLALCSDPALHLGIWAASTAGLAGADLRRELSVSGKALSSLAQGGPQVALIAETIVVPLLLESASRDGDVELQALLEAASPGALVLEKIASWAGSFEVADPAQGAVTNGECVPPSAAPVRSPEDAAAFDEWALRLHGLSPELMAAEAERMRHMIAESSGEPIGAGSIRELAAFIDGVGRLRSTADEWLERLPSADALVRDRLEADAAAAQIGHEAVVAILRLVPVITPKQLKEVVAYLSLVPAEVRDLLRERPDCDAGADLRFVIQNAALLAEIKDDLGDDAVADLMTDVAGRSAEDAAIELASILRAAEFFKAQVGGLEGIGVVAVRRRAAKERVMATSNDASAMLLFCDPRRPHLRQR